MRKILFLLLFGGITAASFFGARFLISGNTFEIMGRGGAEKDERKEGTAIAAKRALKETPPQKPLEDPPKIIRAVYLTAWSAGSSKAIDAVITRAKDSEINAVVIDIKDHTGIISYETDIQEINEIGAWESRIKDVNGVIKKLHEAGIYVIARITVFQDPEYTKAHPEEAVQSISRQAPWKDYKGLSFIDVSSKPFWDYIVTLAKISYSDFGFDELNFDYIRYPSDGPMQDAVFVNPRKAETLETFFTYLHDELSPTGAVLSADLFGMTATNEDDLNIGQVLERALPYFDYIAPMVYPSHYPKQFNGWANPNAYAYEVVHFSMARAVERTIATTTSVLSFTGTPIASTTPQQYTKPVYDKLKLRPWLQDFDYGGDYGPEEVRAQIQATYDAGLTSWMLWSPSNRYTIEALHPEE